MYDFYVRIHWSWWFSWSAGWRFKSCFHVYPVILPAASSFSISTLFRFAAFFGRVRTFRIQAFTFGINFENVYKLKKCLFYLVKMLGMTYIFACILRIFFLRFLNFRIIWNICKKNIEIGAKNNFCSDFDAFFFCIIFRGF